MIMPHFLLLVLLFAQEETSDPFAQLNPESFQVRSLPSLFSPTAIAFAEGKCYVACDHLEGMPGIYLLPESQRKPGLVFYMPQVAVEGLTVGEGVLHVVSSRTLSSEPQPGQIQTMAINSRQALGSWSPGIEAACTDERSQCGIVAAWQLDKDQWLVVTKQNVAEISLFRRSGASFRREISLPLYAKGMQLVLTSFTVIGDSLVFLASNRWALIAAPIKDLYTPNAWRLQTKVVFDLSPLKKRFPIGNVDMRIDGYAEDFTFDDKGRLYVLLNNRGYDYDNADIGKGRSHPKLVIYAPMVKESTTPLVAPEGN